MKKKLEGNIDIFKTKPDARREHIILPSFWILRVLPQHQWLCECTLLTYTRIQLYVSCIFLCPAHMQCTCLYWRWRLFLARCGRFDAAMPFKLILNAFEEKKKMMKTGTVTVNKHRTQSNTSHSMGDCIIFYIELDYLSFACCQRAVPHVHLKSFIVIQSE